MAVFLVNWLLSLIVFMAVRLPCRSKQSSGQTTCPPPAVNGRTVPPARFVPPCGPGALAPRSRGEWWASTALHAGTCSLHPPYGLCQGCSPAVPHCCPGRSACGPGLISLNPCCACLSTLQLSIGTHSCCQAPRPGILKPSITWYMLNFSSLSSHQSTSVRLLQIFQSLGLSPNTHPVRLWALHLCSPLLPVPHPHRCLDHLSSPLLQRPRPLYKPARIFHFPRGPSGRTF